MSGREGHAAACTDTDCAGDCIAGEWQAGQEERREMVNHPQHYGGADNPYEAIKIIEAHNLNFNLGNSVKYILRCDHKGTPLEDLRKAAWYLNREIENRERNHKPKG